LEGKHVSPAPRDTLVEGQSITEPGVPWPHARSSRDGIIAQFGASRADLVGCALVTGDPLADAVVEEIHSGQPGVEAALNAEVCHGLESLSDPPPAVAALLASTETRPASVDDEPAVHGLRTRLARLRQDAAAWQAAQEKNIATAQEIVHAHAQPAAYEQQAARE
jgi:hypothetical protein